MKLKDGLSIDIVIVLELRLVTGDYFTYSD